MQDGETLGDLAEAEGIGDVMQEEGAVRDFGQSYI